MSGVTIPDKTSPALARAIQHEQACQQVVAHLTHESLYITSHGTDERPDRPLLEERLAEAQREWQEALDERRRMEEEQLLFWELDRLRSHVTKQRSAMSRWERWRESRRFNREQ
jgi:hypothetical protein